MGSTSAKLVTLATLLIVTIVLPTGAVADIQHDWEFSRVSIVWPHDEWGAERPVAEATLVNVSVWPASQVHCAESIWEHPGVLLGVARDNEFASLGTPPDAMVLRTVDGVTFPSLEYNDLINNLATGQFRSYKYFAVAAPVREGIESPIRSNIWVHASDPRTFLPEPVVPAGYASPTPDKIWARVQIVWPHDEQGRPAPVGSASLVNIAVDLFGHSSASVLPEYEPPSGLVLWRAEGNGFPTAIKNPQKTTYVTNGKTYPRWVFNDVPVTPGGLYNFFVEVPGVEHQTTIWTHAADAWTILPNPAPPPSCVP